MLVIQIATLIINNEHKKLWVLPIYTNKIIYFMDMRFTEMDLLYLNPIYVFLFNSDCVYCYKFEELIHGIQGRSILVQQY